MDEPDADINFGCMDPEPPGPAPLSPSFLRAFVDSYCVWIDRCFPHYFPSVELCRDAFLCTGEQLDAAGATDAWLGECIERVSPTAECRAAPTPLPCSPFGETARAGESCHLLACEPGHYCRRVTDETCPVCTPLKPLGAACTASAECEPQLYCDDVTSTCQPLRRRGDACTALNDCGSGRCIEGACRDALGEGETCTDSTECAASLRCEGGACSVAFTLPGAPCDARKPCIGSVCEEGVCVAVCVNGKVIPERCASDLGCGTGERCEPVAARCVPRARFGEACSPFVRDCISGHYCDVTAGCTPLRAVGAGCASGVECVSTYCQRGICTPKCACEMP